LALTVPVIYKSPTEACAEAPGFLLWRKSIESPRDKVEPSAGDEP
jgi:hypothetical protein